MTAPLWLFIWIMFMAFAVRRLILYLHVFQQEEYDAPRFLKWVVTTGSFDKRLSLWVASLLVIMMFFAHLHGWVAVAIVGGLFISAAWRERNPLKDAKKKLVLTARAKRILAFAIIYAGALGLVFAFLYLHPIYWLIPIQAMPLMLALAVWTLAPQEAFVQRLYWREAHEKLGCENQIKVKLRLGGVRDADSVDRVANHHHDGSQNGQQEQEMKNSGCP